MVASFGAPAAAVVALEPLTAPVAAMLAAHGAAVLHIQAGRGARAVVPIGSARSAAYRAPPGARPERIAIGLLGDLLGHEERELLARTGLALQRGRLGVWLVGEEGALMVRPAGRRVDCWCVRVAEPGELPAATAWPICCSPCARTSRVSPPSPTSISRGHRRVCCGRRSARGA